METIICCTASEARGNPGPAAIGVYITDVKGEHISEVSKSIGNASSNFAEYYAAMVGLQTLQSLYEEDTTKMIFELRLSNELVKKQLNSESVINDPGLVPMFIEIHNMRVASFPNLALSLVSSEENQAAGKLVMAVLDGKG